VELVVAGIVDRGDASHHLAVAAGEEEGRLAELEPGVLLRVEEVLTLHQKRRHPVRGALVELERAVGEGLLVRLGQDGRDGDPGRAPRLGLTQAMGCNGHGTSPGYGVFTSRARLP